MINNEQDYEYWRGCSVGCLFGILLGAITIWWSLYWWGLLK